MALFVAGLIAIFVVAVAAKPKLEQEQTADSRDLGNKAEVPRQKTPASEVLGVRALVANEVHTQVTKRARRIDVCTLERPDGIREIKLPDGREFRRDNGELFEWPSCRRIYGDEWHEVLREIERQVRRVAWGAPPETEQAPKVSLPQRRYAYPIVGTGMSYTIGPVGATGAIGPLAYRGATGPAYSYDSVYQPREDDE